MPPSNELNQPFHNIQKIELHFLSLLREKTSLEATDKYAITMGPLCK